MRRIAAKGEPARRHKKNERFVYNKGYGNGKKR